MAFPILKNCRCIKKNVNRSDQKKKKNPSWFWLSIELVMSITTIKSTLLLLRASQWKEGSRDQNSCLHVRKKEETHFSQRQNIHVYICMRGGAERGQTNKYLELGILLLNLVQVHTLLIIARKQVIQQANAERGTFVWIKLCPSLLLYNQF